MFSCFALFCLSIRQQLTQLSVIFLPIKTLVIHFVTQVCYKVIRLYYHWKKFFHSLYRLNTANGLKDCLNFYVFVKLWDHTLWHRLISSALVRRCTYKTLSLCKSLNNIHIFLFKMLVFLDQRNNSISGIHYNCCTTAKCRMFLLTEYV